MPGFTLLNSLFLWGLTAAAVPVIIHLIKRNRAVKVNFAAIRFLQVEPDERYKSQRVKQLILLLMRVVALIILAFAFARPFFADKNTGAFWGEQSSAKVILIDNSYSMQRGDNFQKAVANAQDLLRTTNPRDRVAVMQFSGVSEVVGDVETNARGLANTLGNRLQVSARATNFQQAMQSAETVLLESPNSERMIYIISDFQKSGWESLNPYWRLTEGIGVNFIPVENENTINVGVVDVLVTRDERQSSRGTILARVQNFSEKKAKTAIHLFIKNKKMSLRNVNLEPGEEHTVKFSKVALRGVQVSGYVSAVCEDDELSPDNYFYFTLENSQKVKILAVNGEPNRDVVKDELFYLERAVNLPEIAKYSLEKTTPRKLKSYNFSDYRVILLANVKDIKRKIVERLKFYVRNGGGLILALGDQVNVNIYNSLLEELSPAVFNNRAFQKVQREDGVILAEMDYQHPVFRLFAESGQSDPGSVRFYQYIHVTPSQPEAVLASFDDGGAAILERKIGDGKVLLFTSSLDNEWNNMPVKSLYLPLFYQMIQYVAAESKGQKSYLVGNPVSLPGIIGSQISVEKMTIKLPSGDEVKPESDFFEALNEPGIYEVTAKNKSSYFAVNVDAKESNLTALSPNDLQAKAAELSSPDVQVASINGSELSGQIENRQKLWRFAILFAILLLVGETWLGNRTYR